MSSTELGWQAFIATTSFGAGYTTLVCVSLTMDYEIQNWSGAPTRIRLRNLTDGVQACDADDYLRRPGCHSVQHICCPKIANVRGYGIVLAHLVVVRVMWPLDSLHTT
jgi:hypothetical protein